MIDRAILVFIEHLNLSWSKINELEIDSGRSGLVADWLQAMWEAIVEAYLPLEQEAKWLVAYGDGADCQGASSRFSFPQALPTHMIVCRPIGERFFDKISGDVIPEKKEGYVFDRFVSLKNGWYFECPPFEYALLEGEGGGFHVVSIEEIAWGVSALP